MKLTPSIWLGNISRSGWTHTVLPKLRLFWVKSLVREQSFYLVSRDRLLMSGIFPSRDTKQLVLSEREGIGRRWALSSNTELEYVPSNVFHIFWKGWDNIYFPSCFPFPRRKPQFSVTLVITTFYFFLAMWMLEIRRYILPLLTRASLEMFQETISTILIFSLLNYYINIICLSLTHALFEKSVLKFDGLYFKIFFSIYFDIWCLLSSHQ